MLLSYVLLAVGIAHLAHLLYLKGYSDRQHCRLLIPSCLLLVGFGAAALLISSNLLVWWVQLSDIMFMLPNIYYRYILRIHLQNKTEKLLVGVYLYTCVVTYWVLELSTERPLKGANTGLSLLVMFAEVYIQLI